MTPAEYFRILTENSNERMNTDPGYNKALQVVPLRQKASGAIGPLTPPPEML